MMIAFVRKKSNYYSGSSSSFDDNLAGGASINNVAAEFSITDLSAAFNADVRLNSSSLLLMFIIFSLLRIFLQLRYWDNAANQWVNWEINFCDNSNSQVNFFVTEVFQVLNSDVRYFLFYYGPTTRLQISDFMTITTHLPVLC
jgi:hypothetical protein